MTFAPGARNGRRDLHRLLATAAGASLLTTFVGMAAEARLPLLGNVAQHRATLDDHDITQLNVVPCISVPSEVAAARAQDPWTRTMETAPVLKACDVRWCPNRALSSCERHPRSTQSAEMHASAWMRKLCEKVPANAKEFEPLTSLWHRSTYDHRSLSPSAGTAFALYFSETDLRRHHHDDLAHSRPDRFQSRR